MMQPFYLLSPALRLSYVEGHGVRFRARAAISFLDGTCLQVPPCLQTRSIVFDGVRDAADGDRFLETHKLLGSLIVLFGVIICVMVGDSCFLSPTNA